ncbi:MAG: DsbA family protein [Pseudomonadota bacterium]
MSEPVDVFWSFRSPYSYLVTPDLLKLKADYDVDVRLRVVFPIAIRTRATLFNKDDRKPAMYILMDSARRAEFLGLPYAWPNPDPIVQDYETLEVSEDQPFIYRLSALGVEAQRQGRGIEFAAAVSRLIFGGTQAWDQGEHLRGATASVGLDLDAMDAAIAEGDHLAAVEKNQEDLEAIGHWGVPTLALRGEPFFGQDRVETLRWRLDKLGVARR